MILQIFLSFSQRNGSFRFSADRRAGNFLLAFLGQETPLPKGELLKVVRSLLPRQRPHRGTTADCSGAGRDGSRPAIRHRRPAGWSWRPVHTSHGRGHRTPNAPQRLHRVCMVDCSGGGRVRGRSSGRVRGSSSGRVRGSSSGPHALVSQGGPIIGAAAAHRSSNLPRISGPCSRCKDQRWYRSFKGPI